MSAPQLHPCSINRNPVLEAFTAYCIDCAVGWAIARPVWSYHSLLMASVMMMRQEHARLTADKLSYCILNSILFEERSLAMILHKSLDGANERCVCLELLQVYHEAV